MRKLIRQTRGLWVALVVVLVAGATGATASAAEMPIKVNYAGPAAQGEAVAGISALNAKQKKAKKRELKKCRKKFKRKAKRRKACIKRVNKKYRKLANRNNNKGVTKTVLVKDDFYDPNMVNLKPNDWIVWNWKFSTSREGHNVSLMSGPSGVSPFDFESSIYSGPGQGETPATFKRQFKKVGVYNLFCTLHAGMTMTVKVKK